MLTITSFLPILTSLDNLFFMLPSLHLSALLRQSRIEKGQVLLRQSRIEKEQADPLA